MIEVYCFECEAFYCPGDEILLMSRIIQPVNRVLGMTGGPWGFVCLGFLGDSGVKRNNIFLNRVQLHLLYRANLRVCICLQPQVHPVLTLARNLVRYALLHGPRSMLFLIFQRRNKLDCNPGIAAHSARYFKAVPCEYGKGG
ncbi:MAG: hypothetical protein AB2803_01050 [Candidatus Thiodiazotropha sp.]